MRLRNFDPGSKGVAKEERELFEAVTQSIAASSSHTDPLGEAVKAEFEKLAEISDAPDALVDYHDLYVARRLPVEPQVIVREDPTHEVVNHEDGTYEVIDPTSLNSSRTTMEAEMSGESAKPPAGESIEEKKANWEYLKQNRADNPQAYYDFVSLCKETEDRIWDEIVATHPLTKTEEETPQPLPDVKIFVNAVVEATGRPPTHESIIKRINPPSRERAFENMVQRMEETNAGLRAENSARQAKLEEHSKKEETVVQSLVEGIEDRCEGAI